MKSVLLVCLALLFVVHNDLWWWTDSSRWFGLPVGLAFHLLICFAAALVFWGLTRYLPYDPQDVAEVGDLHPDASAARSEGGR
ncbi:MAG: hypothetical protein AAGD01_05845 [Acidobacteriota bacterium]